MFLDFSGIPKTNTLFLDYINNFDKVSEFYEVDFRRNDLFNDRFKSASSTYLFRNEIPSIIRKQYQGFQPSGETLENINKLNFPESLAIVTGQQVGIFGGPLYTVYKVITAIKLCTQLKQEYNQFNFIPVFWLEADDHDFDEIRSLNLINENNELKKISYNMEMKDEENFGSVGNIKITEIIDDFINNTKAEIRETEFTPVVIEKLRSFYSKGKTFSEAFKELLFWLFDKYGLIIFDPQDKMVKQLLIPVFKKELAGFRQHSETLVKISAKLEESHHAQVKIRAINLFHNYDEGRYLIEPVENDFRLKRKRKKFTFDELNDLIEKAPETFSPNVLLRPICQDFLLPTAVYVAGPGEIAYFPQVLPLYEYYDLISPVIYPRSSATIIEKNIAGILEKYGIDIRDVFNDNGELKNRIIAGVSEQNVQGLFQEAEADLGKLFEKLSAGISKIDKTIYDSSAKYHEKIAGYLGELKAKTEQAHSKKHEVTIRQLDKVLLHLFPDSNLQERELNLLYYLNKYGPEILDRIFQDLETGKFKHQIIEL